MSKYFGTDGIRGEAEMFTPQFIQKIAMGLGQYAGTGRTADSGAERPLRVLIGGDTRESGEWILSEFEKALETVGIDHGNVGVLPTPGINYAFFGMGYDLAIDVTASHNPYTDNGIKIFERGADKGRKLSAVGVEIIENAIDKYEGLDVHSVELAEDLHADALDRYLSHLAEYVEKIGPATEDERHPTNFRGLKIGLDCANGATSVVAQKIFEKFGADVVVVNDDGNYGKKINDGCGSTHLEPLQDLVKKKGLDFGAAFDGDGDRCLMIDRNGNVVDGDQMIAILATYLKLPAAAVTVMTNQGFINWAKSANVALTITDVGDQNVSLAMQDNGILIGGEQSGHIILPGETMGDGILTALVMTKVIAESSKDLSELASIMQKMPQVLVNVKVPKEVKQRFADGELKSLIDQYTADLSAKGWKLLVRASGTEPLIRITIWGDDDAQITKTANELAEKINRI